MKKKMLLIWHEAGNPLYKNRFEELSKLYDLKVIGFKKFQNVKFHNEPSDDKGYKLCLHNPLFQSHWLTVISFGLIYDLIKNNYDYIYIHEEPHSLISFLTCLLSKKAKLLCDAAVINMKGNMYNKFEGFVYRKLDIILARNEDVSDILSARGAPNHKIIGLIGNGVSRDIFFKDDSKIKNDSDDSNKIRVGYAGRIWYSKGLELLIPLSRNKKLEVIVCGPIVDEELAEKLTDNKIKVMPKLDGGDLREFYNSLDLFILPSLDTPGWKEQFGRVIVESVFCGTPCLGSSTGFIPHLVGDPAVFKSGDQNSLIAKVNEYLSNEERANLLNEQSKRLIDKYSWKGISSQVEFYLEKSSEK